MAKYDTCYEIDHRFHVSESDLKLQGDVEHFGSRRINLAMVGVGRMGAIHLYNVLREPRALVRYLVDPDVRRLDFMRKKYFLDERNIKCIHTDEWQQVIQDKDVEAVFISTPTYTHEKYARDALEAGKHVLCEKPLAESPEAIDSLVKLARDRGLKLICAFQRRYDPSFTRVAEQIKRGDIGPLRVIKTCSRDSPLPPLEYIKVSGGIYHDCYVHDLDNILWYANQLPIEVHTYGHAYAPEVAALNDLDTAIITMKFADGLISVADLSRVGPCGYEQRVEVFGPKGVLKIDEVRNAGWEKHTDIGKVQPSQCYSFATRYSEAYCNEVREFFNHIEGNKTLHPIRPGYLQALNKIVHALVEASRTARPVKISWTPQEIEAAFG